jgi:hypothetical protein
MQLSVQLLPLVPQSTRQLALLQLSVQALPRLLPHLSWQAAPEKQSTTASFALLADAVHVVPALQLK